ncbi:MAG: DUF4184 family protein [Actinobacteria bacterium]|nr:DUF4184 family protein [Actinomycetota bacterium]
MPFTPSHIAAVLPLRGRAGRGLPIAALAAGSVSPDLLYFQPFVDWRLVTPSPHSLAGIVTWDLLLGFALWAAWRAGAHPLHDLMPDPVRRRWQPGRWPADGLGWAMAVAALLVGAITHVVWDEFTHAGRFGATHLAWLATEYGTPFGALPGYRLAQYASGFIGLVIVLWVGLRQPVTPAAPRPRPALARSASWVVAASAILAATLRLASLDASTGLRSVVFSGITAAMGTAAATVVLITTAHALTSHRPAPTDPTLQRIRQDSR